MKNEFLSLTDIGRIYGVSSHKVGKWLTDLGYRAGKPAKPTDRAFAEGTVEQCPSTQPGTYFWLWHTAKTTDLLDKMGYQRATYDPDQ